MRTSIEAALTRPLGPFEHFLWATDKWTPRHFVLAAKIESELSAAGLADALVKAQRRHPALRVGISGEYSADPRFVSTEAAIPLRLVTRDSVTRWSTEAEAELALRFRAETGPLLRCALVHGETVSEVIMAVHHAIGDGLSAMYLLRDLLHAMRGHELAELPPRPSLEELILGEQALAPAPSSPQPPSGARLDRPGQPTTMSFEIEPCQAEAILARCRWERTTLQGALMAAAMVALGRTEARCLAAISLRRLCPQVDEDFGLYISSAVASFDRHAAVEFWPLARHARAEVAAAFQPQSLRARFAGLSALLAASRDPRSVYEAYRKRVTFDVVLSNLGRFPASPLPDGLRVTALHLLLNAELEPGIAVASAEGRICVSVTFDSATRFEWFGRFEHLIRSAANPGDTLNVVADLCHHQRG